VTIDLDTAAVGVAPSHALDAEHPEDTVPISDGRFTLDLPPYGVRLLRLENKQP
jgi:hypothetical protein